VVLIDDDQDDFFLTRDLLAEVGGFSVEWKSSYEAGLEALCSAQYDLCLLDYQLDSRTGLDLLGEAKRRNCLLPVILLTGQSERSIDMSAMELGADDFLDKRSLSAAELERAIRYTLLKHHKAEELERIVQAKTLDLDEVNRNLRQEIKVRQQTDAALRESEQRFRHLADAMPQIVWISNPEGQVEYINRQWTLITGLSLEESRSLDQVKHVIHPDDFVPAQDLWRKARELQTPYQVQTRFKHAADGKYRWYLTRGVPVFDGDNRLIKWYGTSTDIHEQKELEVEQREAVRRKDEFLAGLAHELRNPLPPMRNALEIMRLSGNQPEAVERGRAMIERQVKQLVRLIDDLLDLSRFTRGKIRLQTEKVDLANLLEAAVEAARPHMEAAGHRLIVRGPTSPIPFIGDPTRLTQAVVNLLHNAAKYTNPGGEIHLAGDQLGGQIVITVKDNGLGISKDRLKHIFEVFVQDERAEVKSLGGLGIGLALVKSVVSLHGGTVQAVSEGPGTGSEFILRLPPAPPEDVVTK
jgi:PAS domain S-box-containing protein